MAEFDPETVQRLTEDLGRELYHAIPAGADALVFNFSAVGRGSGGYAWGYAANGDRIHADPALAAYDLADSLRESMYRPGVGTWFSAKVTVTAQGSMDVDFGYDDEPVWDEGIPDHWFVTDLERFPRDDAHRPEWLKARLAAAAGA